MTPEEIRDLGPYVMTEITPVKFVKRRPYGWKRMSQRARNRFALNRGLLKFSYPLLPKAVVNYNAFRA